MSQFDGIILSKTLVKEQDLIVNVLHQNGTKVSFYIYGGKSSKKNKSSIVEYGHVLTFKMDPKNNNKNNHLKVVKEYQLKWSANKLRNDFKAFYIMSFYLEIMSKVLTENDDYDDMEHKEFYSLLANGIYFLDQQIGPSFNSGNHLFLFLVKLIFYLGIMPDLEYCMITGEPLESFKGVNLDTSQGGFIGTILEESSDLHLLELLKKAHQTNYKEVDTLNIPDRFFAKKMFQYFCVNMDFKIQDFKLYSSIF